MRWSRQVIFLIVTVMYPRHHKSSLFIAAMGVPHGHSSHPFGSSAEADVAKVSRAQRASAAPKKSDLLIALAPLSTSVYVPNNLLQ
jgi:hypothetical protein